MAGRGSRFHERLPSRRWSRVRVLVFRRDGYRCRACGLPGRLECDHVRPLHQGGDPWDLGNLQTLCRGCHVAKTATESRRPDPDRAAWRALVSDMLHTPQHSSYGKVPR